MTIRLAVDSDDLSALIPAPIIQTYSDLIPDFAALSVLRDRFKGSQVILIDRGLGDPTNTATTADFERGALTIAQARTLLTTWHEQRRPYITAYCDYDNLPALRDATDGLQRWQWTAYWGHLQVPGEPTQMIQFASSGFLDAHVDLSLVYDDAWWPDPVKSTTLPAIGNLARAAIADLDQVLSLTRP